MPARSFVPKVGAYECREWTRMPAASDVSDRWVDHGWAPKSPLVAEERALLVRSHAAPLAAVHR